MFSRGARNAFFGEALFVRRDRGADLEDRLCPCDRLSGSIDNIARLVFTIRIAGDAAALIGRDLILVDHPFKHRTVAEPIGERFRLIYPRIRPEAEMKHSAASYGVSLAKCIVSQQAAGN